MAAGPPIQPGVLSPDGTYRWNGAAWVPVAAPPARRRSRFSRMWVFAGCAVLLLLVAVGIGYPAYSFINRFFTDAHACLPSDFPMYPGATTAGVEVGLNGAYPGFTCHVVFESRDDVASVTAFYQSKLNTGDWWVTTSDEAAGNVTFQSIRAAQPFGTVNVAPGKSRTEITIDLLSQTCLPLIFPRYPRSGFAGQSYDRNGLGDCKVALVSNDSVAAVTGFYLRNLNTLGFGASGWEITSNSGGVIHFRHRNGKRYDSGGTMTIAASGPRTLMNIDTRA